MGILERLGNANLPRLCHRELGKYTTLKGRRVTFDVFEIPPLINIANMFKAGITFGIKDIDRRIQHLWFWYNSGMFPLLHDGQKDNPMKGEFFEPLFNALKEAIFYERIVEETLEIEFGEANPLNLKFEDAGGGKLKITHQGNDEYEEHLYQKVAYEICSKLKSNYVNGLSLEEVFEQVWFPRDLINNLMSRSDLRESNYWQINIEKKFRLTDVGNEFLKNYKSPLEEPQPVEESKIEEIRASNISVPEFTFINDSKIKDILKRDWLEIERSLKVENWKSAIILCGGVLEALLLDSLRSREEEARIAKIKLAETDSNIKGSSVGSWNLYTLIEVATELKLITKSGQKIGAVLRDFRNLVHPQKEAKGDYSVSEHIAGASFNLLQQITKDLEQKLS